MDSIFNPMFIIPGIVLVVVFVAFAVIKTIVQNYHKVAPNEVAVVSGRKYKYTDANDKQHVRGYRLFTGGGFFRWPVLQKVDYLDLTNMSFTVEVRGVPDKNGALVNVKGIANVKILSTDEALMLAVERFLGFKKEQIAAVAKETLEANLRAITGTVSIENLIGDRQMLQAGVMAEAVGDLAKMGLGVDLLNVQEITDDRGYIEALGKKRTAEVVRDATIGEAEAHRDAAIKSAEARRLGAEAEATAARQISDAERERDIAKAQNEAQVRSKQARIEIAAQTAAAEETQQLNVAEVEAQKVRTKAETELQDLERERRARELEATVVVQAEKDKESKIIAAEAEEESATKFGEALRIKEAKAGEGVQARLTAEAIGRKASAEALQAEKEASAAGRKAELLAEADGERARLLAQAEGEKARLLAEAEGVLKKAEAFRQLDEAGRFLMIIEALPPVIEAIGSALEKVVEPAAKAIGEGLGNVNEIRLVDLGGGNANSGGGNVLSQFSRMPVETIYGIVEKIRDTDMGPFVIELAKRAGIDLTSIFAGAPSTKPESPSTPPSSTVPARSPRGEKRPPKNEPSTGS